MIGIKMKIMTTTVMMSIIFMKIKNIGYDKNESVDKLA